MDGGERWWRNGLARARVPQAASKVVGRLIVFALLATYAALAACWIPRVRGQINPDGISYISLAQRYLVGDFASGVSGHWGPMFSWLLMPLLALGIEPLLACKIETFTTGLATLFATWLLSSRYTQRLWLRTLACVALVPFLLAWAGMLITPDLLMVCFLTYYFYFVFDSEMGRRSTVAAAIFGGLSYLAKSYGLFFFLIHFSLICAARWLWLPAVRRGEFLRRYGLGLAVFCALSLPWAIVLSVKYDRITFGTAGAYNLGLVGPANGPVGSQAHPMDTQGLLEPPGENAVSAWDDPALMRFPAWPGPAESLRHMKALLSRNISILYEALRTMSPLAWPLLLGACVISIFPSLRNAQSRLLVATVIGGVIYATGFLPLVIDARYLWILVVISLMIVAGLIDLVAQKLRLRAMISAIIAAAILATFVRSPWATMPLPAEIDVESAGLARALVAAGTDLRGRRLASNGYWTVSLYVAYFTGSHYFGTLLPGNSASARDQLDKHRVDTFLLWGNGGGAPAFLHDFTPVSGVHSGGPFVLYERAVE